MLRQSSILLETQQRHLFESQQALSFLAPHFRPTAGLLSAFRLLCGVFVVPLVTCRFLAHHSSSQLHVAELQLSKRLEAPCCEAPG